MKTLKSYILLAVMALALSTQAQVLRNADYQAMGRISPNGMVRNAESISVGSFEPDGTVCNREGTPVGRINRLEIFDTEGTRVGYINTNGVVHNGEGVVVGTINLSDGKVTNDKHEVLGYARGIRVDWIACYFFFDFFKK
ncbi:MAG: hypothetical protein J6S96_03430 [Muribaculaceae bacterium]|nr:hypothetical protein [Muribaculaceae bacterium]